MTQTRSTKSEVKAFWGEVYDAAYAKNDEILTHDVLARNLADLEDMFRLRGHLATSEMTLDQLAGKKVLEIGPGAGGHSALFAKYGAEMTSVDITFHRARATQVKFDLMDGSALNCHALQGDAENLPFPDSSFDIVYSNGVLHHTPDTEKAIAEVHRLVKPGGQAVIMLYCKSSFAYWFNLWFCAGILMGGIFKSRNWLGHNSEWIGTKKQANLNPVTRCYTRGGIRRLFRGFNGLKMRKAEFYFYLIPKLGRFYRHWQIKRYGTHPGGIIVYGDPWPIQAPLELWLGKYIGFAWFITATKPEIDKGRPSP